jgi:hypothetical protein
MPEGIRALHGILEFVSACSIALFATSMSWKCVKNHRSDGLTLPLDSAGWGDFPYQQGPG